MDKNNNPFIPETVAYMPIQKDDPYYKMDHKYRGWAYIFNHNTFTDHEERVGTEKDVNRLKKTLQNLKFAVHIFEDLPYEGVMDRLHQGRTTITLSKLVGSLLRCNGRKTMNLSPPQEALLGKAFRNIANSDFGVKILRTENHKYSVYYLGNQFKKYRESKKDHI